MDDFDFLGCSPSLGLLEEEPQLEQVPTLVSTKHQSSDIFNCPFDFDSFLNGTDSP